MLNLEKAFNILGLQKNESINEVRNRFLKLAKQAHPDKSTSISDSVNPNTDFIAIKQAYEFIIQYMKSQNSEFIEDSIFDGFIEPLDISDLEFDDQISSFIYTCRCGEVIQIHKTLIKTTNTFSCQTCSLKFKLSN